MVSLNLKGFKEPSTYDLMVEPNFILSFAIANIHLALSYFLQAKLQLGSFSLRNLGQLEYLSLVF